MDLGRGISLVSFGGTTVDGEYKAVGFWGAKELDAGSEGWKGLTVGLDGGRKGEASSGYAI